jgi:hypothetical protein
MQTSNSDGFVGQTERLRRLAEEGRLSGLLAEDGEKTLDRLEAKYRSLAERKDRRPDK